MTIHEKLDNLMTKTDQNASGGKTVINLGSNRSYDIKHISGWEQFTTGNFLFVATGVSVGIYTRYGAGTQNASVGSSCAITYDSTTGVVSVIGYTGDTGWQGNAGASATINGLIYLVY